MRKPKKEGDVSWVFLVWRIVIVILALIAAFAAYMAFSV